MTPQATAFFTPIGRFEGDLHVAAAVFTNFRAPNPISTPSGVSVAMMSPRTKAMTREITLDMGAGRRKSDRESYREPTGTG
jgi:hypothetical protein